MPAQMEFVKHLMKYHNCVLRRHDFQSTQCLTIFGFRHRFIGNIHISHTKALRERQMERSNQMLLLQECVSEWEQLFI